MSVSRAQAENELREMHMLSVGISARDFEFLSLAGNGSNGAVFIAKCKRREFPFPEKLYAVKMVFNFGHLSTASRKNQYEAEFTLYTSLKPSPFIVRSFGMFHGEVPRVALEFLPPHTQTLLLTDEYGNVRDSCRTLFGVFEGHPMTLLVWRRQYGPILPFGEFAPKGSGVLQCAIALAVQRLIHRDMKPDNVLVKADGSLCVCDIGEAVHLVRDIGIRFCCHGALLCCGYPLLHSCR
jgi:serine/threonine protein kinase